MENNVLKREENGQDRNELSDDSCLDTNIDLSESRCPLSLYILGEEQSESDFNLYLTAGGGTIQRRDEAQERTTSRPYISAENLKKLKKLRFDPPVEHTSGIPRQESDDPLEKGLPPVELSTSNTQVPNDPTEIVPQAASLISNSWEKDEFEVAEHEKKDGFIVSSIPSTEPIAEKSMFSVPPEPVLSRPEPVPESEPVVQTSSQAVIITMEKVRTDPEEEDGRFGIFDHFVRMINGHGPLSDEVIEHAAPHISETMIKTENRESSKDLAFEVPNTDHELKELCSLWNGLTAEQRESLSIFLRTLRRS